MFGLKKRKQCERCALNLPINTTVFKCHMVTKDHSMVLLLNKNSYVDLKH